MVDINTGSVTQESCQAFCEGKFGNADSKFIPVLPGRINPPDVGDTYDEAKDIFYEDQPKSPKDGTLFSINPINSKVPRLVVRSIFISEFLDATTITSYPLFVAACI